MKSVPVARMRKPRRPTRWTATSIMRLPPRSSPYTDPETANLQLFVRARANGSVTRTWLWHGKFRSQETRLAIGRVPGMTLSSARADVQRLRDNASQGIDPRRSRPRRTQRPAPLPLSAAAAGSMHSIDFLATEFVERFLRPSRKDPAYAEGILNRHILPDWRGRDARSIKPREVVELLDKVAESGPVMANRTAGLLGTMFKWGIHRSIVDTSPVQLLFRPGGKEKPRKRALSDKELRAYLSDPLACTRFERLSHVITLLLLTGQRRGELALAPWSDVDLRARTWTIPDANAKAGRGHVVPLSDWAVDEFKALKDGAKGSLWVLPAVDAKQHVDPKLLTRGLAKCLERFKKRGIASFTLHDLRRTCRTGLGALKVAPHIAERVLNHAQPGIESVYDRHAYLEEKREALAKWAEHLKILRP